MRVAKYGLIKMGKKLLAWLNKGVAKMKQLIIGLIKPTLQLIMPIIRTLLMPLQNKLQTKIIAECSQLIWPHTKAIMEGSFGIPEEVSLVMGFVKSRLERPLNVIRDILKSVRDNVAVAKFWNKMNEMSGGRLEKFAENTYKKEPTSSKACSAAAEDESKCKGKSLCLLVMEKTDAEVAAYAAAGAMPVCVRGSDEKTIKESKCYENKGPALYVCDHGSKISRTFLGKAELPIPLDPTGTISITASYNPLEMKAELDFGASVPGLPETFTEMFEIYVSTCTHTRHTHIQTHPYKHTHARTHTQCRLISIHLTPLFAN
jgi:hypothetical protein